jgi:hypothetical protein
LAAVLVFAPKLLDLAAGPDAGMRSVLQQGERAGLALAIPGTSAVLVSRRLHYDRVTTHVDDDGEEAFALSTLDFEGTLGSIQVSSLGVERIPFERSGTQWRPRSGLAPRLAGVIAALEARRQALEAGDAAKLVGLAASPETGRAAQDELLRRAASAPKPLNHICAWYIRLERNRALVTEDYRIGEGSAEHPPKEKGTRRLTLERQGPQFLFSGSLL